MSAKPSTAVVTVAFGELWATDMGVVGGPTSLSWCLYWKAFLEGSDWAVC